MYDFLLDDRMVWIMGGLTFNRYSIDQNKFLEQDFLQITENEEDEVTFLSARQAPKGVDFYYRTFDNKYTTM